MNANNPNEQKSEGNTDARHVSVPDYGGGADGDMRDDRQADPTRNAGTAAKKDVSDVANSGAGRSEGAERGSGERSRKDEIDASTDAAVKAGVGTAAALGLGAAFLGK